MKHLFYVFLIIRYLFSGVTKTATTIEHVKNLVYLYRINQIHNVSYNTLYKTIIISNADIKGNCTSSKIYYIHT